MWPILVGCAYLALASARTIEILPKSSQDFSPQIAVNAEGVVTKDKVTDFAGSVAIEQAPFVVGLSRSDDSTISAILGYINDVTLFKGNKSPVVASVNAQSQISAKSVQGQLAVSTSSLTGNPSASLGAIVTKNGLTNYALGLGANSNSGEYQANVQLTGVPNQGVSVQASTQIGPVTGIVSRDAAGTWEDQVSTKLVILENPQTTLTGKVQRHANNKFEYLLSIESPAVWSNIHIDTNKYITCYLGGSSSGVLKNTAYSISGDVGYLAATKAIHYKGSTTIGPVTGTISGDLYNSHSLNFQVALEMFVLSLTVGSDGSPSYSIEINAYNGFATLLLDANFKPYSLSGTFGDTFINISANTDFSGDYNFSVQTPDQIVNFTL